MKVARVHLQGLSPYSQSKYYDKMEFPKLNHGKEGDHEYRLRTWREHCHVDDEGWVTIPATSFKNCLSEAAKYNPRQIPGKGKSTYTKNFEAGVLVLEGLRLHVKKADVASETLFLPSDGKRGSGKRVLKTYPVIPSWKGVVAFYISDETITKEVFHETLSDAGMFIGLGRFRPRNNGTYGRFKVLKVDWAEHDLSEEAA